VAASGGGGAVPADDAASSGGEGCGANALAALSADGAALALSACTLGHDCAEVVHLECSRTTFTVQSPNDAWPPGSYTLAINVDGAAGQCTLEVANPPQRATSLDCAVGSKNTLTLEAVLAQQPLACDQAACRGSSATPIPGHFQLSLVLQGLPKQVALNLARDGTEILNKVVSPTPKTTEPDGPGCGQCTSAQTTLIVGS